MLLHGFRFSFVECVLAARDETKVAGFVPAVDIDPVQLKFWRVPPREGNEVLKKRAFVIPPENVYAAPAIIRVPPVSWIMASADTRCDAVKKPRPMVFVRYDIAIAVELFTRIPGRCASTLRASRCGALS